MSDDYLWDRSGPEDPEVAKLEQLLAPLAYTEVKKRRPRRIWIGAAVVAAAAIAIAIFAWPRAATCDGDGFRFTTTASPFRTPSHRDQHQGRR